MSEYILGESAAETERLLKQAEDLPIVKRLEWAGLRPGLRAVDAGCGPGENARQIAKFLGPGGSLDAFDLSEARLATARALPVDPGAAPIRFALGDISRPPYPPGHAQFVCSQFVVEYLADVPRAIAALRDLLEPGGVLCIADIDGIGGTNWPTSDALESGLRALFDRLARTGLDQYVGRKLYSLFIDAGLSDVQVRIDPMVHAGRVPVSQISAWEQRFEALAEPGVEALGGPGEYRNFVSAYMDMLKDERTLRFREVVTVRGAKR